jgi:hypothetical protein
MSDPHAPLEAPSNYSLSRPAPAAWRAQPKEEEIFHLKFLWWAFGGGELDDHLSRRFNWAERRLTIETYEGLEGLTPGEMGMEAAMARVRITLVEIMKLQSKVMSDPDSQLQVSEVMNGIEWMISAQQGIVDRKAQRMDWKGLSPEEREIMLKAKEIQDRLMGDA